MSRYTNDGEHCQPVEDMEQEWHHRYPPIQPDQLDDDGQWQPDECEKLDEDDGLDWSPGEADENEAHEAFLEMELARVKRMRTSA